MGSATEQPTDLSDNDNHQSSFLTEQETRSIITPFAFKIDTSLFGITLATPWPRAVAILIDLLFIAVLSNISGQILALLVAVILYRASSKSTHNVSVNNQPKKSKRKAIVRFCAAFIVFVTLFNWLPVLVKQTEHWLNITFYPNAPTQPISSKQSDDVLGLTAFALITLKQSNCDTQMCWQKLLQPLMVKLAKLDISTSDAKELITMYIAHIGSANLDKRQLNAAVWQQYQQLRSVQKTKASKLISPLDKHHKALDKLVENPSNKMNYSLIHWGKAIIDDLGVGFGWAAFYFTVFTSLWQGQTPGKKIMKIKVLQLDGTALSLIDSFGRYGGYGAGVATGLLGFLQIFWDPNRQAIHDKISSTVVVKWPIQREMYK